MPVPVSHAYSHLIGRIVGIHVPAVGIVSATVVTPEIGQDDNDLLVTIGNGDWVTVKYMDTYRADFVNAYL